MSVPCFVPADILLPAANISLDPWACIAVDQFTSQPEYWQRAEELAAGKPSTLHIVLPEAYLGTPQEEERMQTIRRTMQEYRKSVLTRRVRGFVYVERTQMDGTIRQGLVGAVDLEAYDYNPGSKPAIRPSEKTVVERIPPRLKVRRGAILETPHVMMLADDEKKTLIEPIGDHKDGLPLLYDGELMLGGGHVAGWAVEDPALIAQIENALTVLGSQEEFDKKYPDATRRDPLTLAVGDGNHSLATAKACWEELKKTLTPEQAENHPARWCLAEVCNVHSPAIEIEPIHRVLFNVDCATVLLSLITWSDSNMAGCCFGGSKKQPFTLAGPHMANVLSFEDPTEPLTVGTIDDFISDYIERHPEAKVDYVHDEPAVRALCKQGAVAFLMPPFAKSDLFRGVVMGGVLPRKTFSMGHAEEKRYYIECRKITE